jgi:hypothetical protein
MFTDTLLPETKLWMENTSGSAEEVLKVFKQKRPKIAVIAWLLRWDKVWSTLPAMVHYCEPKIASNLVL